MFNGLLILLITVAGANIGILHCEIRLYFYSVFGYGSL